MSKVYTRSNIERGEFPKIEGFGFVIEKGRKAICELHDIMPLSIPAATIFGSCAIGRQNVCSDIDIIVLVQDRDPSPLVYNHICRKVRECEAYTDFFESARRRFVEVAVYPVIFSVLASHRTKNDKQFLSHVYRNAGKEGLICGSKDSFSAFFEAAPEHTPKIALLYIGRKLEKLEERLFNLNGLDEKETARMYLDTFQAPFHALRRLLDLVNVEFEDSKLGLIKAFEDYVGKKQELPLLELVSTWRSYVVYVETASEHKGLKRLPFEILDVEKAIFCLKVIQGLVQSIVPRGKN